MNGRHINRDIVEAVEVTQQAANMSDLRRIFTCDCRTNAADRTYFLQIFERGQKRWLEEAEPVALVSLDNDHFKAVMTSTATQSAIKSLAEFARICSAALRLSDPFLRLNGDEFAVFLPHTTLEGRS